MLMEVWGFYAGLDRFAENGVESATDQSKQLESGLSA